MVIRSIGYQNSRGLVFRISPFAGTTEWYQFVFIITSPYSIQIILYFSLPSFLYFHSIAGNLLNRYQDIGRLLSKVYLNYPWNHHLFFQRSTLFWSNLSNQREYIQWIGKRQFDISNDDLDRWYAVDRSQLMKTYGGNILLTYHYNLSMYSLLSTIYPEYQWKGWLFEGVLTHCWIDPVQPRYFVNNFLYRTRSLLFVMLYNQYS